MATVEVLENTIPARALDPLSATSTGLHKFVFHYTRSRDDESADSKATIIARTKPKAEITFDKQMKRYRDQGYEIKKQIITRDGLMIWQSGNGNESGSGE